MAPIRLMMVSVLLVALLAGCATSQPPTFDTIYAGEVDKQLLPPGLPGVANGTTISVIHGSHLEARLNDGAWDANLTAAVIMPEIQSPAMTGPEPSGGGGESTPLPVPSNLTLEVRIKEYAELGDYTAWWVFMTGSGNVTTVARPADAIFEFRLATLGPYTVNVLLTNGPDDMTPVAVYNQTIAGSVSVQWTVTGEVQPVHAPNMPSDRNSMVDKYTVDLPEGITLTAVSSFEGSFAPGDGTDVDLGIYGTDGTGLACVGSGGGAAPVVGPFVPDPAQSSETVTFDTDTAGQWSVEVGTMATGCSGQSAWTYTNAGPVPYKLVITTA